MRRFQLLDHNYKDILSGSLIEIQEKINTLLLEEEHTLQAKRDESQSQSSIFDHIQG